MSAFFSLGWLVTLVIFIVFWRKKANARKSAGANYRDDLLYQSVSKTKRIIGAICIVFFVLAMVTSPGGDSSRDTSDTQGKFEREAKLKAEQEAKDKAEKEKKVTERISALTDEEKGIYESKYREYSQNDDELTAKEKAIKAVDEYLATQKNEQQKKEKEQKALEEKRKGLVALEQAGKIQYYDLGNNTFNVVITDKANLQYGGDSKKIGDQFNDLLNYAVQDDHERNIISTSRQCMKLVQTVKEAGINVNRFTVHLTGRTVDSNGYKSEGTIVTCEIGGSTGYKKDDPYSFYNNSDRYWMIDGL